MALGRPSGKKTFGEYADRFVAHILKAGREFDRIDVTFDQYRDTSIKAGTRDRRTKKSRPIRRLIEHKDVPLPNKWTDFLALPDNKRDLSIFLSNALIEAASDGKTLVVAGGFDVETTVKTNNPSLNTEMLCGKHEEADTRIILHCIHTDARIVVVLAHDTDVLVLLITHFSKMKCQQLWMKARTVLPCA
jgi:hypothetical protein